MGSYPSVPRVRVPVYQRGSEEEVSVPLKLSQEAPYADIGLVQLFVFEALSLRPLWNEHCEVCVFVDAVDDLLSEVSVHLHTGPGHLATNNGGRGRVQTVRVTGVNPCRQEGYLDKRVDRDVDVVR